MALALSALSTTATVAHAEPGPVIVAGREAEILALFRPYTLGGEIRDGVRLAGVQIETHAIVVQLTGAADARGTLRLTSVRGALDAATAASFELNYLGPKSLEAASLELIKAIRANDRGTFFRNSPSAAPSPIASASEPPPPLSAAPPASRPAESLPPTFLLTFAAIAIPGLVGFALGRIARTFAQRWVVLAVAALPWVAFPIACAAVPRATAWDVAWFAACVSVVSAITAGTRGSRVDRLRVTALVVSIAFVVLSLEVTLRLLRRRASSERSAPTAFASLDRLDAACGLIFDAEASIAERLTHTKSPLPYVGRTVVLHVGDSMVEGVGGAGRDGAFPAVLEELSPGTVHLNAGAPGASLDGGMLIIDRWIDRVHPRWVFVYIFLGNDVQELDKPCICCGLQPLLTDSDPPSARCTTAQWRLPLSERVRVSPAPFVVRALSSRSALAAALVPAFAVLGTKVADSGLVGRPYGRLDGLSPGAFARFEAVIRAIATRVHGAGAGLTFVILPARQTVERSLGLTPRAHDLWGSVEAGLDAHRRVRDMIARAGEDSIDAWDFWVPLTRDSGDSAFSRDTPGDFHLSALGHRGFAEWLRPRVEARVPRPGAP